MAFTRLTYLGPGQTQILRVDRFSPDQKVWFKNRSGGMCTYRFGTGRDVLRFADPDTVVTLAGTATLTNGSAGIVGIASSYDTELVAGDIICLADGKILMEIATTPVGALAAAMTQVWNAPTVAGATLYKVSQISRTIGPGQSVSHNMPAQAPDGSDVIQRHYLRTENVHKGELEVAIAAPEAEVTLVQDSLTNADLG